MRTGVAMWSATRAPDPGSLHTGPSVSALHLPLQDSQLVPCQTLSSLVAFGPNGTLRSLFTYFYPSAKS